MKTSSTITRRFVALWHDAVTVPHFDLMIERPQRDSLWTWRCPHAPLQAPQQLATRIENHRIVYLDYEGELSNNRGIIRRIAGGDCTLQIGPRVLLVEIEPLSLTLRCRPIGGHQWEIAHDAGHPLPPSQPASTLSA